MVLRRQPRTDKTYPYSSVLLVPNGKTIPFVCPHCSIGLQANIYVDVRDRAIALGNPLPSIGGITTGQRFMFVNCAGCSYWYRTNDNKRISNIALVDV